MRTIVFAILIALLPLRSWAGDAMAIQMAAQSMSSAAETNADHADCMEHMAFADEGTTQDKAPVADGHCNTCAACQACSAIAFVFPETAIELAALHHSVPLWAAARFTSADRALGQKPPIS